MRKLSVNVRRFLDRFSEQNISEGVCPRCGSDDIFENALGEIVCFGCNYSDIPGLGARRRVPSSTMRRRIS